MAYDDSEALQPDNSYGLGGYTFDLNVSYIHEPDEDLVAVSAICNGPDGRRESAPVYVPNGTAVESWYVEANETEASVYATFGNSAIQSVLITTDVNDVFWSSSKSLWRSSFQIGTWNGRPAYYCKYDPGTDYVTRYNGNVYAANVTGDRRAYIAYETDRGTISFVSTNAPSGANMIFAQIFGDDVIYANVPESRINPEGKSAKGSDFDGGERLVARFAIDIREADGGPDGDWDEPGDTGDPSYTLNVCVTGASSGSNSGIPLEAQEQTTYGSGGYGGNGGGGGAGASTVIIYEFATDKAGTVNQEATAQGPGSGGPGGKGGKGGDGCILIFY